MATGRRPKQRSNAISDGEGRWPPGALRAGLGMFAMAAVGISFGILSVTGAIEGREGANRPVFGILGACWVEWATSTSVQ